MKLRVVKYSPLVVFVIYIAVIVFCALIYYLNPSMLNGKKIDLITSLYFSVITITTVGYGDIGPATHIGEIIAASEAFLGIIIIGLFLNSLWQSYTEKIAKEQERVLLKQQKDRNANRIKLYYAFLKTVLTSFKSSIAELTLPLGNRSDQSFTINPDFKFSDLKDLYTNSLILTNGLSKSVIEIYFDSEIELINELKYFLANFDIFDYSELHENILQFLTISKMHGSRDALLSYISKRVGDHQVSEFTADLIKEYEICPDISVHKSSVLTPVILLYHTLKEQINAINIIENKFSDIKQ
jgi:hypothetical protein